MYTKDTLRQPLLYFVRRLLSLRGSKCFGSDVYSGNFSGPQVVSFAEKLSLVNSAHDRTFHCNMTTNVAVF
jgi:hypothetical protein